ncbi:MAG: hypothetical protein ACOH5I_26075 [Oligoflexus sp.]
MISKKTGFLKELLTVKKPFMRAFKKKPLLKRGFLIYFSNDIHLLTYWRIQVTSKKDKDIFLDYGGGATFLKKLNSKETSLRRDIKKHSLKANIHPRSAVLFLFDLYRDYCDGKGLVDQKGSIPKKLPIKLGVKIAPMAEKALIGITYTQFRNFLHQCQLMSWDANTKRTYLKKRAIKWCEDLRSAIKEDWRDHTLLDHSNKIAQHNERLDSAEIHIKANTTSISDMQREMEDVKKELSILKNEMASVSKAMLEIQEKDPPITIIKLVEKLGPGSKNFVEEFIKNDVLSQNMEASKQHH